MHRYLEILRLPPFAALWFGSTVSAIGDTLTWVALVWLTIDLGGVEAVAPLVVAYTAPVLIGGLVMGALLDRFDRRRLLMSVNAVLAVAVASIPVLAHLGSLEAGHLTLVAAAYGLLKMANWAGVPALIPALVPEWHLTTANALESATFGIAEIAGPAIAGVLIATIGGTNVLAVDAATYLLFVGVLARLRVPREPQLADGRSRTSLRPAFAFALRQPAIRATTLMYMVANVGEGIMLVLVPAIARRELGGGPAVYGILLSSFAVSVTAGAFAVGAVDWRWPLGRSIAVAQTLAGVAILGLAVATTVPAAALVLVVTGLLVSPLTVWAQTIRMRVTPPELRGRTFGLLRTLMQSTPPLGGLVAGAVLAGGGGVVPGVVLVAACFAVPGALGLVSRSLDERHTVAPYAPRDALAEADTRMVLHPAVPRGDDRGAVAPPGDQPRGREGLPLHGGGDRRDGGAER